MAPLASIMSISSSRLSLLHSSSLSLAQAIPVTGSLHERHLKPIRRQEPCNSSLPDEGKALSWVPFSFFFSSRAKPQESSLPPAPAGGDPRKILQDAASSSYEDAMNADVRSNHTVRSCCGHKKKRRVVVFTPQKARELRRRLRDTDSFHDLMYHSAIASRLASNDDMPKDV